MREIKTLVWYLEQHTHRRIGRMGKECSSSHGTKQNAHDLEKTSNDLVKAGVNSCYVKGELAQPSKFGDFIGCVEQVTAP